MAGESYLTYGVGYSFDGAKFRDEDGYFDGEFQWKPYFDRELLQVVEPFHASEYDLFAVLARSTVRSGDPQDWDHGYGLQLTKLRLTPEESRAFESLRGGLRFDFPALLMGSEPELLISLTADI